MKATNRTQHLAAKAAAAKRKALKTPIFSREKLDEFGSHEECAAIQGRVPIPQQPGCWMVENLIGDANPWN